MSSQDWLLLAGGLLLVLAAVGLAAAEAAMLRVSDVRLAVLAEEGNKRAARALRLVDWLAGEAGGEPKPQECPHCMWSYMPWGNPDCDHCGNTGLLPATEGDEPGGPGS